ncbi:MAG: hypothetical protein H6988_09780 [Pseudomonadales bacterium]|nr:hypothetical protein [Ardenticatenaceae bacterium]MCP5190664.1 hypothetical protein [Pseudomonadales bacterium]
MIRKFGWLLSIVITSVLLMGAVPQQTSTFAVPWWGWLLIITVALLVMFLVVLLLDVRAPRDEDKS